MRLPGVKTEKKFSRWLRVLVLGGALTLGCHHAANVKRDKYEVGVTPKYFAEYVEIVNKYAHPISLAKQVQ